MTDLVAGKTPVNTYMRDGLLFLQTVIDEGYLDVGRIFTTLPNTEEKVSYFSEGNCVCINSICRAKVSSCDYPLSVGMTALPVLSGGVVCMVGADQRSAARYRVRTLHYTLAPGTR